MAFLGLFRKKKKNDIKVSERKQSALQDAAVAATFAEAGEHETARSMIDTARGKKTILVISRDDHFSEKLAAYATEMAKRLDFELLAVNTTDAPLTLPPDQREEAAAAFARECEANSSVLREKADNEGIPLILLTEVGHQDEIIERLHTEYPGMRFVLTEPDIEAVRESNDDVAIPVFDLGSYHGASA